MKGDASKIPYNGRMHWKYRSLPWTPTFGAQCQYLWNLIVFSMQMKPLGSSGGYQTSHISVLEDIRV